MVELDDVWAQVHAGTKEQNKQLWWDELAATTRAEKPVSLYPTYKCLNIFSIFKKKSHQQVTNSDCLLKNVVFSLSLE